MFCLSEQTVYTPNRRKTVKIQGLPLIPQKKERKTKMSEFIFFIIGCMLGGLIGVTVMCCLQINRLHENQNEKDDRYGEDG